LEELAADADTPARVNALPTGATAQPPTRNEKKQSKLPHNGRKKTPVKVGQFVTTGLKKG
jgi:hypothetical protein